jgi:hypothetical protein
MLKTSIKKRLWRALAGKVKLQPLFEALHHYSLTIVSANLFSTIYCGFTLSESLHTVGFPKQSG